MKCREVIVLNGKKRFGKSNFRGAFVLCGANVVQIKKDPIEYQSIKSS